MKAGETSSNCPKVETERNWGLKNPRTWRGGRGFFEGGPNMTTIKEGEAFEPNSCSF